MKVFSRLKLFGCLVLLLAYSLSWADEKDEVVEDVAMVSCQLLIAKSTCWGDRAVTIRVIDALTFEGRQSLTLKKGDMGVKQALACEKFDQITFQAKFEPAIWQGEEERWYQAQGIWNVPGDLDPEEEWIVRLCFPDNFMRVPMLPSGDVTDCHCDFSVIVE